MVTMVANPAGGAHSTRSISCSRGLVPPPSSSGTPTVAGGSWSGCGLHGSPIFGPWLSAAPVPPRRWGCLDDAHLAAGPGLSD